jgi:TorA maturation chaperone TorD
MSDTNLAPLFTYLDDKFVSQNKRFDALDEKFQTLQTSVDGLSKLVKDYQDELFYSVKKWKCWKHG